jgi:hypothetical protein
MCKTLRRNHRDARPLSGMVTAQNAAPIPPATKYFPKDQFLQIPMNSTSAHPFFKKNIAQFR